MTRRIHTSIFLLCALVFLGTLPEPTVFAQEKTPEQQIESVKSNLASKSHKDWLRAVETLLDLLTQHPHQIEAKKWLEKALKRMDKILEKKPEHAEALYKRSKVGGRLAKKSGIRQSVSLARQVRKDAEKCIELQPKHTGCLTVLGVWHHDLSQGLYMMIFDADADKALPLIRRALKHSEDPIAIQYELAKILHDREKTDELQSVFRNMKKQHDPDSKMDQYYLREVEKLLPQ